MEDIIDLLHCCVIIHNMIVEAKAGAIGEDEDDTIDRSFPLFGHEEISAALAALGGVDLFAARVDAFDTRMQSGHEHFKLKQDLVEHIHNSMTN